MKKVIVIPDSFKGSMSALEVCEVVEEAVLRRFPQARVLKVPVADGGEGSVDCFLAALGGRRVALRTQGPRFEEVDSFYGILPNGTAVVEMAASAGLPLMGGRLSAEGSTTCGAGQLLAHAAAAGCRRFIVGLGGSATNDGGCGAAAACGLRFYNAGDETFVPTGATLHAIRRIDASGLLPQLSGADITAMCDIDNPLCGPTGAARVFGPQKGADEATVEMLDAGLRHLAEVIKRDLGKDILDVPGAGAAGGMGGGMLAFFGARLQMGIQAVLNTVGFDAMLENADLVLTGEGKLDTQSLRGKVVIGVARRARAAGVPVVALVGDVGDNIEAAYGEGLSAVFSINRVALPFSEAKHRSRSDLALTAADLMRYTALWVHS